MNVLRVFDFITKVGTAFSLLGELITRLGLGGRIILPLPEDDVGHETKSQDSSTPHGGEDEKPAEYNDQADLFEGR